jgi:hypothetical protein
MKSEMGVPSDWLTLVGQAMFAVAGLLTWAALLVVWFRVTGDLPPSNGCPIGGLCTFPFMEVLSATAAFALAVIAASILVAAAIPRVAIVGGAAGLAAVIFFHYFVYVVPADRPMMVGPELGQATLLAWLGGVLAIAGAAVVVGPRWLSNRRSSIATRTELSA